jgi:hypothetical protein
VHAGYSSLSAISSCAPRSLYFVGTYIGLFLTFVVWFVLFRSVASYRNGLPASCTPRQVPPRVASLVRCLREWMSLPSSSKVSASWASSNMHLGLSYLRPAKESSPVHIIASGVSWTPASPPSFARWTPWLGLHLLKVECSTACCRAAAATRHWMLNCVLLVSCHKRHSQRLCRCRDRHPAPQVVEEVRRSWFAKLQRIVHTLCKPSLSLSCIFPSAIRSFRRSRALVAVAAMRRAGLRTRSHLRSAGHGDASRRLSVAC